MGLAQCGGSTGSVTSPAANKPPVVGSVQVLPDTSGLAGFTSFSFTSTGAFDPDNDPLQYLWDLGDGSAKPASTATIGKVYSTVGNYSVSLGVTDGKNSTVVTQPVLVSVRSLSGRWQGRVNCAAVSCAGSFVDLVATITQSGAQVTIDCIANAGVVTNRVTSISTPPSVAAANFSGSCGGSSADMLYDAKTDRINVIWRVDWIGNLVR
jgi:PKD repeat protein